MLDALAPTNEEVQRAEIKAKMRELIIQGLEVETINTLIQSNYPHIPRATLRKYQGSVRRKLARSEEAPAEITDKDRGLIMKRAEYVYHLALEQKGMRGPDLKTAVDALKLMANVSGVLKPVATTKNVTNNIMRLPGSRAEKRIESTPTAELRLIASGSVGVPQMSAQEADEVIDVEDDG